MKTPTKARRNPSPRGNFGGDFAPVQPDPGHLAGLADLAERLLSCCWCIIAEGQPLPTSAADVTLDVEAMPTAATTNLLKIIGGCAEAGVAPSVGLLLAVADQHDMPVTTGGGDARAELRAVLERESTPAGLARYAAALSAAHHKRRQAARLWRRLAVIVEGLAGDGRANRQTRRFTATRAKLRPTRKAVRKW